MVGPQRPPYAVVGEHRVQRNDLFHREFDAAEDGCEAVVIRILQIAYVCFLEQAVEVMRADSIQQVGGGDIAAEYERVAREHRAEKATIEILR